MAEKFLEIAFTKSVLEAQEHYFGKSQSVENPAPRDELTEEEITFIRARDSFYMATVSESGWPYMQHRGGHAGFLQVVTATSLAFADYRGNRQLLSTGNLAVNDRVCLFLMDYPQRTRLKILGHARVEDAREHPELVRQFAERKFSASSNASSSLKSFRLIGTVQNTSHRAILSPKWNRRSNLCA